MAKPPFIPLHFAKPAVTVSRLADGGFLVRSPYPLEPYAPSLGTHLRHWATEAPDRPFLAERAGGPWRRIGYREALESVRAIGQALLDRGLGADRPVAILSDNSVNHGLLALGAMHVGIPVAPISVAYSLVSKDFARLRTVADLLRPGLVYAADGARFAPALRAAGLEQAELVVDGNAPEGLAATPFSALLATRPGPAVERAFAAVGPDTIAKILFTSGSTGQPKGVINTQRMLCSNQQSQAQLWRFAAEKPPVLVDWLPWNHTFGGNFDFNFILRNGGTLYIDEGKPAPGLIEKTVANLREVSPTLYLNVPRGYDMLIPYLEQDAALRDTFFKRLDLLFYAGAALPQHLWARLEALSIAARGQRVVMISSWGATETAPMATTVHYEIDRAGVIGLPGPGTEIKLVPNAGKLEMLVRGPNVTPGYWRRADLTRAAFDAEGFYRIGDAGRFADPEDPLKGLEFDGRIAEDFKLMSGTWVPVGMLRVRAIAAAAPIAQDIVIAGHDREEVGLLVFPNPAGCRALCPGLGADASLATLIAQPEVRGRLADALRTLAGESTGSATRPTRALFLAEPPQIDAGEITDKGYVNQRAVLERRAEAVRTLFAEPPGPEVILPSRAE
jgi:feruloyl-CoA synthase